MVEANNISKSFGAQKVISELSISIRDGEFVSIMGKSGSGKSTLLSMLSGGQRPDTGTILFDGEDITKYTDKQLAKLRSTKLGFVYQFFNLIATLTIEDNILLPIYLRKDNIKEKKKEMLSLAEELGISHILNKYPSNVSGGEQQRAAILRSLLYHPQVLMLDEPTGNLDTAATKEIMELLVDLNKKGITIIQVTHNPDTAKYGTRVLLMEDGKLIQNEVIS